MNSTLLIYVTVPMVLHLPIALYKLPLNSNLLITQNPIFCHDIYTCYKCEFE